MGMSGSPTFRLPGDSLRSPGMNLPAKLALGLAFANFVLALWVAADGPGAGLVYVFTPIVNVTSTMSADDARQAAREVSGHMRASDLSGAVAKLGSTLSLDDLLRGVESLADTELALSDAQEERLGGILRESAQDHRDLLDLQREILDLERDLSLEVDGLLQVLPAEMAQQVRSSLAGREGGLAGDPVPGLPRGSFPPDSTSPVAQPSPTGHEGDAP